MANPVFSRAEAFQPHGNPYGQPAYAGQGYSSQYGMSGRPGDKWDSLSHERGAQQHAERAMTFDDVLGRTGLVLLIIAAIGAASFTLIGPNVVASGPALIIGSIAAFITAMVVSTRRTVPVGGVIFYCICEGLVLGSLSAIFEAAYPGIVAQAVLGTFAAAGVTLAAYKFFNIRVTPRFRQVVIISTFGFAAAMLINLVLALFGINIGVTSLGPIGILCSALGVVLAAMNLVVDFDCAEQGVRNQAPASESWRAAFGIAVTMVWLYTEILRILSYFRAD
ncbi:Bax inhibitor-1/YccA family protein [Cutibacterium sp. WCA-380-WT-3A]|uniref:Bax inhibitor-1/YccA family protein n=1 Tax=Cutibacterium porci TaxID=2605781 RepID=A0A7K0J5N1_9ACTN|nr:Bax inhibitor-1/YccA family protein [Cutibacterium porci]MSS45212.1 Bax inhibitor-1/YccA family protein [Cutibacterium porci]